MEMKEEKAKVLEEQRLAQREKRLRVAEKQKSSLEDELHKSKKALHKNQELSQQSSVMSAPPEHAAYPAAYPLPMAPMGMPMGQMGMQGQMGMPGQMPQGGPIYLQGGVPQQIPGQQRVMHRHIHHHVHYHDGEESDDNGAQGLKMQQQGMGSADQRQLENASEAQVRKQIETQGLDSDGPAGPFAGFGGVDNFAETPHMRRPSSMGKLMPMDGMGTTQQAFQKSPSLPHLDPHQRPGVANTNFGRNLAKSTETYADSRRPTFVSPGPKKQAKQQMVGGGLGRPH